MPGIVKVTFLAAVDQAKKNLKSFSDDVDKTVKKSGDSWGKLKDGLKVGALAGGAALGAGLLEGLNVEAVTDKLNAQLGKTGADAQKVGKAAGDLYKGGFGDSVEGAADIVKNAFQNGLVGIGDSRAAIQGVGEDIANYITTTGRDAESTTQAVAQILKNGLAPNAKAAFDLLAKGQELGVNKADDLLDTFNEYSTQFRALGIDGPKALGLMNQGLQAGARDADTVADSLKEFAIRAKDGSKTTVDGFKSLGLNAKTMQATFAKGGAGAAAGLDQVLDKLRQVKDPAEASRIAVELFGTKSEDMQAALLALDPSKAVAGLGDLAGAADRAGKTLNDNAKSRLTSWKRTIETNVVGFLGNTVIPAMEGFGAGVAAKIGPAFAQVGTLVQTKLLPAISSIAGQIGPKLAAIGQNIATAFGPLASQVGPAIGVVFDKLKAALGVVAEGFAKVGSAVVAVTGFLAAHQTIVGALTVGILAITAAIKIYQLTVTVVAAVTKAWTAVQAALNVVMNLNPISLVVLAIIGLVAAVIYAWKTSDSFRAAVTGVWNAVRGAVVTAVTAVASAVKTAFNAVKSVVTTVGSAVRGAVVGAWSAVRGAVTGAVSAVRGAVVGGFNAVRSAIVSAVTGAWSATVAKFNAIKVAVATAILGVIKTTIGIKDKVIGALSGAASWLVSAGRDLIQGMINGVKAMAGNIAKAAAGVVGDAVNAAKAKLGIKSPSTVFLEIGRQTVAGLQKGLEQTARVQAAAASLAGSVESGFGDPALTVSLADQIRSGGTGVGGAVLPLQINVYALADGPDVGRRVVDAIGQYENFNGTSWRAVPA